MTTRHDIEARLDRSLANQVQVPKLDRRFDAAVWARIEAESSKSLAAPAMPRKSAAERWLFASNVIGFAVTALLVLYFGARMFMGVEVDLPVMPALLPELTGGTMQLAGWCIAITAIAFGLLLTPRGRRLRSEIAALY
ncbi:MAG TPA: hypothetical protein VKB34_07210 [Povalibacter sp.]|nr:hypothetical protein [Povalibacter sp.]